MKYIDGVIEIYDILGVDEKEVETVDTAQAEVLILSFVQTKVLV